MLKSKPAFISCDIPEGSLNLVEYVEYPLSVFEIGIPKEHTPELATGPCISPVEDDMVNGCVRLITELLTGNV
jgi:hypothetical protein